MGIFVFKLPDLGEGVVEGEIVKWLVKPGDAVEEDAPLVEVMTDKATVVIPSPQAGTVVRTFGQEGQHAQVHHPLVELEVEATGVGAPKNGVAAPSSHSPTNGHAHGSVGEVLVGSSLGGGDRVLATPVTRRMAQEHHVDLQQIAGTGPYGRVLKTDLEAFLAAQSQARAPSPSPSHGPAFAPGADVAPGARRESIAALSVGQGDQRVPLRGLRKKIAEKMVRSKFTAPHYAFVEEVDATALVALRTRINGHLAGQNLKLSFLPFFVKAVVAAFRRFPHINANMDEATGELIVRQDRHIGIATMTEQGLTVPVLRHADRLSVRALSEEIARLAESARHQHLKLEELSGGTFTITSLGQTGGLFATPIINHPEVAIMGVHRMRKQAVVAEDERVVVRQMMHFSFCFDHRVIDGATGADFAYEVIRFVEHPELLMVDMI